ncbi:3114_t:CDS:10 [Ambispora leptoticha]|uniref:Ubiquitin fusion degradation protein 1 n=1 Tax=Ambispora leptoticha TaxID=144679 RepID=A0A9N8V7Z3_9GLOM|nr:3114_t:CDS:10 [Ambispora leptoticha]
MFGGYDRFESGLAGFGIPRNNPNRGFSEMYRCYSVIMMQGNERQNVNFGGKIILPPSALEKLASLNIEYPMLFELRNTNKERHSHAGVLEFIAEEGRVYLPHWMMQTLLLEQGDIIEIKNATLPLGNFVKIQPQSVEFLDISDPKAVLENALRNFATLTQGDIIEISYNTKIYEIMVLEVRPHNNGISILETDLEVDFAPPVGYVEPKPRPKTMADKMKIDEPDSEPKGWSAFTGSGQRLNGKTVKVSAQKGSTSKKSVPGGTTAGAAAQTPSAESQKIPGPLNLPFGKLYFGYDVVPLGEKKNDNNTESSSPKPFSGEGQTLRAKKSASSSSSNAVEDSLRTKFQISFSIIL